MKNILIITDYMPSGGAATFVRGLSRELLSNPQNHLTSIFFYDYQNQPNNKNGPKNDYFNLPLNTYNGSRIKILPQRIKQLIKILPSIKDRPFDIVYTDLIYPTLTFQIARLIFPKLRHLPIYHHIHGSFLEETRFEELRGNKPNLYQKIKYKLFYYLEHFTLKHCQKISVNSYYSEKLTRRIHDNLPIIINKPGIDSSFSTQIRKTNRSTARVKLGLNPKNKYILFTSRIEPRKGVSTFFENFPNPKYIDAKFIICGHFIENRYLYDFLEKLDQSKLGSDVFLINSPSRYQLSLLYRAANVTVMPSIDLETFGFSTLESYYYSTPVVAFDIGANSELIPPSHLVKYPSKNSWLKLYQKINYLLTYLDSTDYSKYNYSWREYVDKLFYVSKK